MHRHTSPGLWGLGRIYKALARGAVFWGCSVTAGSTGARLSELCRQAVTALLAHRPMPRTLVDKHSCCSVREEYIDEEIPMPAHWRHCPPTPLLLTFWSFLEQKAWARAPSWALSTALLL